MTHINLIFRLYSLIQSIFIIIIMTEPVILQILCWNPLQTWMIQFHLIVI